MISQPHRQCPFDLKPRQETYFLKCQTSGRAGSYGRYSWWYANWKWFPLDLKYSEVHQKRESMPCPRGSLPSNPALIIAMQKVLEMNYWSVECCREPTCGGDRMKDETTKNKCAQQKRHTNTQGKHKCAQCMKVSICCSHTEPNRYRNQTLLCNSSNRCNMKQKHHNTPLAL